MDKLGRMRTASRTDPLATMRSTRSADVLKNANGQILVEKPADIGVAVAEGETTAPEFAARNRTRRTSTGSDGAGSHGSHGSDAMIIKQTKEWSVRYEE